MSNVPRSWQNWVSAIQTVALTGVVFQFYKIFSLSIRVIVLVLVRRMVMENRPVGPGKKLKSVSCEYDVFEWLKLNFASCVVHQTRSYNMVFVN